MKRVSVVTLILIFSNQIIMAQNFDLGSWNIINLKLNVNKKWSFFAESQLRSLKFYSNFHYYEYKGGINYKVHNNATITIGAGSYQTYKEGGDFVTPKNNNEFRIWPQFVLFQSLGKLKIEQRYRTELRFTSNGYRNRFRYRLGLAYPFGKKKIIINLIKLLQITKFSLQIMNPILKETECKLHLITSHQNQPLCRLVIYTNSTIKLMMRQEEIFYKLGIL